MNSTEREEHVRHAEAMERASASGTVADDENPSGVTAGTVLCSNKRQNKKSLKDGKKDFGEGKVLQHK